MIGAAARCHGRVLASAAAAQSSQTPPNWSYEIKDGKRVPKAATA